MVTLLFIGVCLYMYGFYRVLLIYGATAVMVITLGLTMVSGGGLSFLFFPEQSHAFAINGELWTNAFAARPGFTLAQGLLLPIIFFFDMVRVTLSFIWQVPNICSIGAFSAWLIIMYRIIVIMWFSFKDDISSMVNSIIRFCNTAPKLYKKARDERVLAELASNTKRISHNA